MSEVDHRLLLERKTPDEIAADLVALAGIDLPYALEIREEIREIELLKTIKANSDHEKHN